MSDEYESIKRGLEEAIAYMRGEDIDVVVHYNDMGGNAAAFIRSKTGLSQPEFAKSVGVSVATLRNWEQGRRSPQGPARVLLSLIDRKPSIVRELLSVPKPSTDRTLNSPAG